MGKTKTGRKKNHSGLPVPVTNGNRTRSGGGGDGGGTRTGSRARTRSPTPTYTRSGSGSPIGTLSLTDSISKISVRLERPVAAVWYHTLVSIGVFIAGVLLVVVGSWGIASRFGGLGLLPISSSFVRRAIRSMGGVCVGIGVLCILAGVAGCAGLLVSASRYGFVVLGLLSLAGLCLIGVCGLLLASRAQSVALRADLALAWGASPGVRVAVQVARKCIGFDTADEGTLGRNNACYFAMTNLILGVTVPTALGSCMGAILLLVDLCVVFLV